jgi:hypothetical protein
LLRSERVPQVCLGGTVPHVGPLVQQQHSNGYSDRDADDHALFVATLQTRRRFAFMPCKPQGAREVRFEAGGRQLEWTKWIVSVDVVKEILATQALLLPLLTGLSGGLFSNVFSFELLF